jgi:hypothetical protein
LRSVRLGGIAPGGGCHAHRRAGICIYDACVDKCVAVLGQAVPAEPPSLPEWALMWDDELLERIPSTSATNIEAGLRDRVRELRDRGMSWARIGVALGMTRQSP